MTRTLCHIAAAVALLLLAWPALGQPAGNAHPQTELLASEGAANPFGAPAGTSALAPAVKHEFASKLDLSPLRDLAVHHGGRTKILDTLAAETISTITNRRDYYDLEPVPDRPESARRLRYDPLFTFLDMIIDPAYYADKHLIGVNYLPVREEFIDLQYQGHDERAYWRRVARITPAMVERHIGLLARSQGRNDEFRRSLGEVHNAHQLYLGSASNLLMAAADHEGDPWIHLASLPSDSAAASAARRLGAAWRATDAPAVNAAARDLAAALPQINAAMYPGAKRSLERIYNASRPFEWGMWLYAASLVSLVLAFGTGRVTLRRLGVGLLGVAVALHLFGFALRCIIAERYSIQNQFESMTGVSLFAAIVGVVLAIARRQLVFAAAASAVGFLILVTATQTAIPGATVQREAAILNTSVLLKYHVTIVLLSYGLIALGCIISLFYLLTHYLRGGAAVASASVGVEAPAADPESARARILGDLDRAQLAVLQLAFWFLGVGILLGGWWADHSWGRWWGWDPKETWALVTWIIYLVVIHVRLAGIKDRGLTTAWLSVLGFVAMLWCYFGVNLLLPGLHAYA